MNTNLELITIGSELLSGRTLNTHAQTLGAALSAIGLNLSRDTTIPDETGIIQSAVKEAFERVDILIVSGGLGPTSDDITREALASLLKLKIMISPAALDAMKARFATRGIVPSPVSERMAQVLDGAETLINPAGAAAAQHLEPYAGKELFIVPGPPNEFATVLSDHIIPWLQKTFPDAAPLELRVLTTKGLGESAIVTRLEIENFQSQGIAIGFYPGAGRVEIRLSAPPTQTGALNAAEQALRELLYDYIVD